MPLPIIQDCYRVAVRGTNNIGAPCINVLHFLKLASSSEAVFLAALDIQLRNIYTATGVSGVGTSGWATFGGGASSVTDYTVTKLDGVSASLVILLIIPGLATGDPLPPDTALVTTFRTGFRGRSFRGRTYWWGGTEANNDGTGRLLSANAVEFNANWNAVVLTPSAAEAVLCVASYTLASAAVVTSFTVQKVFDRQRRRKQ
jgi:hypothetical protein